VTSTPHHRDTIVAATDLGLAQTGALGGDGGDDGNDTYCAICHGESGAGDGFSAYGLDPRPPDLRAVVANRGEPFVARVMRDGTASLGRSPLCPPYGRTLDEAQRSLILAYLRLAFPSADDRKRL
jgi:mono/diheme cytochrome c family protein